MPDDPASIFDRKYGTGTVEADPAEAFDAKYGAKPDGSALAAFAATASGESVSRYGADEAAALKSQKAASLEREMADRRSHAFDRPAAFATDVLPQAANEIVGVPLRLLDKLGRAVTPGSPAPTAEEERYLSNPITTTADQIRALFTKSKGYDASRAEVYETRPDLRGALDASNTVGREVGDTALMLASGGVGLPAAAAFPLSGAAIAMGKNEDPALGAVNGALALGGLKVGTAVVRDNVARYLGRALSKMDETVARRFVQALHGAGGGLGMSASPSLTDAGEVRSSLLEASGGSTEDAVHAFATTILATIAHREPELAKAVERPLIDAAVEEAKAHGERMRAEHGGKPGTGLVAAPAPRVPEEIASLTKADLSRQMDERGSDDLQDRFVYHESNSPDLGTTGIRPSEIGGVVWVSRDNIVNGGRAHAYAIDTTKLPEGAVVETANNFPGIRGEVPPDAVIDLGPVDPSEGLRRSALLDRFKAAATREREPAPTVERRAIPNRASEGNVETPSAAPRTGERGAVSAAEPKEPNTRGRGRDLYDAMRQRMFQNIARADPEAQQHAVEAVDAPRYGESQARLVTKEVRKALPKDISPETYQQAVQESSYRFTQTVNEQRANAGDPDAIAAAERGVPTLIGAKGSAFPTEESYRAFWADPRKDAALAIQRDYVNERVTPDYRAATGEKAESMYPTNPQLGFHHSLLPLDESGVTASKSKTLHYDEGIGPGGGERKAFGMGFGSGLNRIATQRPRTARQRTGGAYAYETDLEAQLRNQITASRESASRKRLYTRLVKTRDAAWVSGDLKGEPTVGIQVNRIGGPKGENTTLYVRKSLVPEVERVVRSQSRLDDAGSKAGQAMVALNITANPLELTTHLKNMAKAVVANPGTGLHPAVESALQAVGVAPVIKFARALKSIATLPAAEIDALDKIGGVLRGGQGGIVDTGGRAIVRAHNGLAVFFNKVYDEILARGVKGYIDSPDARRNFINGSLGNYLSASHGKVMRLARESGFSPFAVAKTTQASKGVATLLTDTGIQTEPNTRAFWEQRALGASTMVQAIVAPYIAWVLLTGKPPPKDVPIGGAPPVHGPLTDPETGATNYTDTADITPVRRGLKSVGLDAADQGRRANLSTDRSAGDALTQIGQQAEGLFGGPLTQFVHETATGKDVTGERVAPVISPEKHPDLSQYAINALESLVSKNPFAAAIYRKVSGESKPFRDFVDRLTLVKTGKGEDYVDRLSEIRDKQEVRTWLEDAYQRALRAKPSEREEVEEQLRKEMESLRKRLGR